MRITATEPTELIRSEEVAALYRNGPLGIVSNLVALCILVGTLMRLGGLSASLVGVVVAAVIVNSAIRTLLVGTAILYRSSPATSQTRHPTSTP